MTLNCTAGLRAKKTQGPRSRQCEDEEVKIDQSVFLHPGEKSCDLHDVPFLIVSSNEMRTVIGTKLTDRMDATLESDESPLQQKSRTKCADEIARALNKAYSEIYNHPGLSDKIKEDMCFVLYNRCQDIWKAKFDLDRAADLPPMKINLKEGAVPAKIRCMYRWTAEQREFMARHLRQLEDVGIISATESEWCCPVVLVVKPDLTWRLCVDPSHLNRNTVPMQWEIPRVREELQERLHGSTWFSKFEFVSMFWQVPLHEDSRKLFCFFAGRFLSIQSGCDGGFEFASIYVQKMVTRLFENVLLDDKPILGNGLESKKYCVMTYCYTRRRPSGCTS